MTIESIYLIVAVFLLINVAGGLLRVLIGPRRGDRMLAAQLFGTAGVAIILLLAEAMERPGLRDVALVMVLLAVVNAVGFVRLTGSPDARRGEGDA